MPGEALVQHLRELRRISRRSAAARALFWTLAIGSPAAVALVLHARLTTPSQGAALERFVVAWAALVVAALGGWIAMRLRRGPPDPVLASALDERSGEAGLFSAAAFLLGQRAPAPALAGVVLSRADEAASALPVQALGRGGGLRLKRTLMFLLLSLLLALIPGGPRGDLSGMGAGSDGAAKPAAGPESRGEPESRPETRDDRQTPLDELVQLALRSDHQIYPLNGEINLTLELKTLRPITSDVPLEVVLAVSDGLPSPDVGFGEGFRAVPLRLDWSIPKEEGGKVKQRFPFKATLQGLGIYRPGLFTCEGFVKPVDDAGNVSQGARSNEITFQVAENKEDLSTKTPQAQGQQNQPEKQTPNDKKDEKGSQRGKSKPKLGDPDRLADAKRVASLVKPIVNAGPTVEKEVSVFEREPGGPAPPLPIPRKPPDEAPARTFLRRAEVPLVPPDLSAEERDVLRRYFDSIRAQKKL